MRQEKGRSSSKDTLEQEEDEAELTRVLADNEGTDDEDDHSNEDDSKEQGSDQSVSSSEAKIAQDTTSDLFVLDDTGNEDAVFAVAGNESTKKRSRNRRKKKVTEGNALTKLLPGYIAPMQLNASSLDKFRPVGGMKELQRQAERSDVSTRGFVKEATLRHAQIMQTKSMDLSTSKYVNAYASFKKGTKRAPPTTAGAGWFHMKPTPMTEELKADMAVIKNRNYLDPKKFYKSADQFSNILQAGTVIEGSSEFFSSRLTKKQRRTNLTDEIMADPTLADYTKNKFKSMSQEKTRESQKRSKIHRPKRGKRGF